jgi:hypothetical protein
VRNPFVLPILAAMAVGLLLLMPTLIAQPLPEPLPAPLLLAGG